MRTFILALMRNAKQADPVSGIAKTAAALLAIIIPTTEIHAQQPPETHRVLAQAMDITKDQSTDVQLRIWHDLVPELLENMKSFFKTSKVTPEMATRIFTASFKDGDKTIIISAIGHRCQSVPLLPYEYTCPARIAEVRGGVVHVLKNIPDFQMSSKNAVDAPALEANKQTDYETLVTYNPSKGQLSTTIVDNGESTPSQVIELQ